VTANLQVPRDLTLKHSALCPYSVIIIPLEVSGKNTVIYFFGRFCDN